MRLELGYHHYLRCEVSMCGGDNCDEAKWAHEYAGAGDGSDGDVEWASMIVVMSTLSSARLVAEMKPPGE